MKKILIDGNKYSSYLYLVRYVLISVPNFFAQDLNFHVQDLIFNLYYWEYKLVRSVSLKMAPAVEWSIVTADFDGFREVHLLIIFSLYRFEFHTKIDFYCIWTWTLIFIVFEMSNFVLTKQHLREILIFYFNWKKSAAEAHRMFVEVYDDSNW